MPHSRLHRRIKFPYYLVALDYRESSSGIQCLHYLCHALNLQGANAWLAGGVKVNPWIKTPLLTEQIRSEHVARNLPAIAIYPDIVSGNPLSAPVCVRYMLNHEGVMNGNRIERKEGDLHLYHRSAFVDPAYPGDVLTVPMVDTRLFQPDPQREHTLDLLYLNRVPRSAVDFTRLPAGIRVLSPDNRLPLEELAEVFRSARVLYTYESSTTYYLALLCGCPVVALTAPGYEKYAVAEQDMADVGGGVAWADDAESLQRARDGIAAVRAQAEDWERHFWLKLDDFIDKTQAQAEQVAQAKALPRTPLRTWLSNHVPTPAQSRLIGQRFAAEQGGPSIAVFVRNSASPQALEQTLHSLSALAPEFAPRRIFVLDAAEPCETDATLPQLQHVVPDDGDDPFATFNRLAGECGCDWLLSIDAGDRFTASGLSMVAVEMLRVPGLRALCADEMMRGDDGNLSALLRPDFNLDLLLSMPSGTARHWLFRREAFLEAGGFDPAFADAPELDLLLRLIDAGGIEGLGHVHEPLLITPQQQIVSKPSEQAAILRHLRHRGYEEASVEPTLPGCYRIHYRHPATPGVSIIIPTRNQFKRLVRCIDTLIEKTAYKNYEILIVDNGSTEEDACTWLAGIEAMNNPQMRVLHYPQPFNYAAMNNLAASHARGEYLVLLNNDTTIVREDWLDAMLNHAQRPEVGVVGAKLIDLDGKVQSAGLIACLPTPAQQPFVGDSPDGPGYMYRLQVDQDYSAVTGACMMVRKSLYDEAGGLDEAKFPVSHGDIDLCLKLRHAGYLVVWTPHAVLLHEGSVSQAAEDKASTEDKAKRFAAGQDALYDRWLPTIAHDPAYNDNLSLNGKAFLVETHPPVTWNPLTWRPLPVALAFAADQAGCGHYRILQPSAAMREFGLATVDVCHRYLSPVEMERASPDTMVLQRQMTEDQIKLQKRVARFNKCFKVAELDDYLPQVPRKSAHHGTLPKDILKTMRKSLTLVDRFVVSTQGLAEMMQGMHPDIRVVENHLPLHWWADVKGERRTGRKPRVGWGGAAGHRGDLELIADVVEALSDEVEWVFFGMCPDMLKPFVHEIVPPVAIGDYPGRLASLNLDLALAPLEDNTFNQCKSNLRLLEYGACGFPVVCSDVRPYQGDLPVTRVKPRFRDWVDAIRMHTHDLDAAAKAGDALRAAVHRDWMLDEKHARFWLSQWMPD